MRLSADRDPPPRSTLRRRCESASGVEPLTVSAAELRQKQLQQYKPPDFGPHLRNRLWSCECEYTEGSPSSHPVRAFPSVAPLRSVCVCVCASVCEAPRFLSLFLGRNLNKWRWWAGYLLNVVDKKYESCYQTGPAAAESFRQCVITEQTSCHLWSNMLKFNLILISGWSLLIFLPSQDRGL